MNLTEKTPDYQGKKVIVLPMQKVSLFALILLIPILLFMGLPYFLIWHENTFLALKFSSWMTLLVFILGGVVVHELLHGMVWAVFAEDGFRSIRFGILWAYLTPYCHCNSPLRVWQYMAGGMAPLILMGLLPAVWAMFTGKTLLMFFGMFYTWTAAGDIYAVWALRKFPAGKRIYDHPSELGFILADEVEENS